MSSTPTDGILDAEHGDARSALLPMLEKAYWMEIETVMSYVANSINPDGMRGQEIVRSLQEDVTEELGHAQLFANRIKLLGGTVPGSEAFVAEQSFLQPAPSSTDLAHVVRGVIEAETGAIDFYNEIIKAAADVDPVTEDMVIDILADEEGHRRLFLGFLRELEAEDLA